MWVDATIAASFITDPKQSKVADKVAFAQAPTAVTPKGANWLWAWALAIPAGSKNDDAAQKFINWATSKDYIKLVGQGRRAGAACPPARASRTYANPEFLKAAKFADAEKKAIDTRQPERQHAAEDRRTSACSSRRSRSSRRSASRSASR